MFIRLSLSVALVYVLHKSSFLLTPLISPIATWCLLLAIAWWSANVIKRFVVLKKLGPVSSVGKAVFVTGTAQLVVILYE